MVAREDRYPRPYPCGRDRRAARRGAGMSRRPGTCRSERCYDGRCRRHGIRRTTRKPRVHLRRRGPGESARVLSSRTGARSLSQDCAATRPRRAEEREGRPDWPALSFSLSPRVNRCGTSSPRRRRRGPGCAGGRPWRLRLGACRRCREAAKRAPCIERGRWRLGGGPWRADLPRDW